MNGRSIRATNANGRRWDFGRRARAVGAGWLMVVGLGILPCLALKAGTASVAIYQGMCDASAIIPIGSRYQVVADDEDNILRLYDRENGGMPVWSTDLSRFLRVDPAEPEVDLEGAARVGDRIYWISSHGRNRKGRLRPSRHRFFATRIEPGAGHPVVVPMGEPSMRLLVDLLGDPRLAGFGLGSAAALPPKAPGALNIEGLAALPDGRLLIGFRNPQPRGLALLVPLENPDDLLAGGRARFGDPILLDLEGRGIRGLGTWNDRVLIAAGSNDDERRGRFFEWQPGWPEARAHPEAILGGLNPEAIETWESAEGDGATAWLVASDDGTVRIGGRECKKLKDIARKQFRVLTLRP